MANGQYTMKNKYNKRGCIDHSKVGINVQIVYFYWQNLGSMKNNKGKSFCQKVFRADCEAK